ncbi:GH92 family glycosyl hydrolase [Microlunatus soli]|uniref:Alpha-1,2-mannosidase, putative n=1 Tax=Microlunatus soli TaxID=630515 RepID=A0A1H1RF68_9ACTN|nr:GH92 family glycosyl hydrolase [Microlunatus soli]SDS34417.1 alpha-1,2-mannosidase, putative [Microlunatus soli]
MIIEVGSGPVDGTTSKDGAGFSSVEATRYAGTADGRQSAVIDRRSVPVAAGDRLRYLIYPELDDALSYVATYAAVDLRFSDGSLLSDLGVTDQYQMAFGAAGQGAAKILYCGQWNDVQVDLTAAAGRTVAEVVLVVDTPTSLAGQDFTGWLDGIEIGPAPARNDPADLVGYVDTRRGSNASGDFSRGNNLPITAWPNGFNFLTPVTNASTHRWPYEYHRANNADNRPELQGLAFSHQPSPWMGDRDQLIVMPVASTEPLGDPAERAAAFSHDQETARPDHYRVRLDSGVVAELAPTDHGAIFRFDFGADAAGRHVIIDTIDDHARYQIDGTVLTGWVENGSEFGRTRMYCYGEFSVAPADFGPTVGGRPSARAASFADESEVVLRIATSFIGTEQAKHNLALELAGRSLEEIRQDARQAWQQRLSVITVEDATEPQLRTLYGCLYRLNLYPNSQFENAGSVDQPEYRYASPVLPPDGESTDDRTAAVIKSGKVYVNSGFWDTYRTAWPAYAFLYPELAAELVDGFVSQYRDGGWVARWSSPGYADLMTGTSSDVAFADAYVKDVPLPDPLSTYDAGLRNATVTPTDPAVGRKGVDRGLFTGYVSTDVDESVSWALEGYLNDFGLALMAERLAADPATPADRRRQLSEEAVYFRRRSLNYVLLFDPKINFFQGRRADGEFAKSPEEFDPAEWGGDFTETDGWNFAFHVAHDGRGLANLYGGRDGLRAKLDEFFTTPELADKKGTYGTVIHEMTEARAVRMGQYGFSNQPAHHIAYLYNYAGAPHRTQQVTREVLQRLFVGEQIGQGYPGDEDNGEMSAWYIFSALGLYPLRVGAPEYAVTAPLFRRAEVRPQGREPLSITAHDQDHEHHYIQSVQLNGRPVRTSSIDAAALRDGGTLDFTLGAEPSTWAAGADVAPPSITDHDRIAAPLTDLIGSSSTPTELFDDDSTTETTFATATPTISWSLTEPARAEFYTLTSGQNDGDPSAWRLEGSADGKDWVLLDERTDQRFDWRRQTRPFMIDNAGDHQHYRLVITRAPGRFALSEIELLR